MDRIWIYIFGVVLIWLPLRYCQSTPTDFPGPPCDAEWFGSHCQYKCHCTNNKCDNYGVCDGDSKCDKGWFGPACQYADLIFTNATSPTPNWLTDSDDKTCNDNEGVEMVKVTFDAKYPFTWLRLLVNDAASPFDTIQVQFTDSASPNNDDCKTMAVNYKTFDVHCKLNHLIDQVIFTGKGVKNLCSIYLSGGRNLALRQTTNQTSGFVGRAPPKLAVDGNTNQDWTVGSCTHTEENKSIAVWNVTFSQPKTVNRYRLYNRLDGNRCCLGRLKGFHLTSYDENSQQIFEYNDTNTIAQEVYTVVSASLLSPVMLVSIEAKNKTDRGVILTLCEVEVYGDSVCRAGKYGLECEQSCSGNCANNDSCLVSTGGCLSGCAAGLKGMKCDQVCDYGKFGQNCAQSCSQFCNRTGLHADLTPCYANNGTCRNGCLNDTLEPLCSPLPDKASFKDSDDPPPIAAIAGSVVGGILLVALIVTVVIFTRRRKGSKENSPQGTGSNNNLGRIVGSEDSVTSSEHEENTPKEQAHSSGTDPSVGSVTESVSKEDKQYKKPDVKPKPTAKKTKKDVTAKGKDAKSGKGGAYYNELFSNITTTSISVANLDMFISSHSKDFFREQFTTIPTNMEATAKVGQSDGNMAKNRYKNICAYDHSRVNLQVTKGKKYGGYINASYIEGYKQEEKFIASQGPTRNMMEDFVRMLWEQKVEKVVMLTNLIEQGMTKCERYWPDDDVMEVGEITIELATTQVFADYTIRRLQLRMAGKPVQELTQFHFTSWPDKDVPITPWGLVDFEQRVASFPTNKPTVVHCSAGVGRTGTFIALRNVMREAEDTGYVDFVTTVKQLRKDRILMVQTAEQYEFLHRAAQVAIVCMGTTVTSNDLRSRLALLEKNSISGQSNMEKEFMAVCNLCDDKDETVDIDESGEIVYNVYQNSRSLVNKLKNRLNNILPKDYYRVRLMKETNDLGDYINAVFVPSFTQQDQQILTQLPLPSTILDFWRLVIQYKVSLIVTFQQDIGATDRTLGEYLPEDENDILTLPLYDVRSKQVTQMEVCERRHVFIKANTQMKNRPNALEGEHRVTHLKCTSTDLDPNTLLTLIKQIRSLSPVGEGRTLYMCRNGADLSGLVCVLSLLLDRMDNDQRLTVPLVVGAIKAIRPQVIPTLVQYSLLYQVLKVYSETSNVYSNFTETRTSEIELGVSGMSNSEA